MAYYICQERRCEFGLCAFDFCRQGILLDHEFNDRIAQLLIASYGIDGAFGVGNGEINALFYDIGHFYRSESLCNFLLHKIYVNITYHNNSLLVGAIPCFIIVAYFLWLEVVNYVDSADRKTIAISAVGIYLRKKFLKYTHLSDHATAPFLMDNSTLLINFLRVKS